MSQSKRDPYADFAALDALMVFLPILGAIIVTKHYRNGNAMAKLYIVFAWVYSIGTAGGLYFYLTT